MIGCNGAFGAFEACGGGLSYSRALLQIGTEVRWIRDSHCRELFDHWANLRIEVHKQVRPG